MEIKGEQVKLTPSEAQWLQDRSTMAIHRRELPGIGQKILDARCAFASQYIPLDDLPLINVEKAMQSMLTRLDLNTKSDTLSRIELKHGVSPDGVESHIIALILTEKERHAIWQIALSAYEVAQGTRLSNNALLATETNYITDSGATETNDALNLLPLNTTFHDDMVYHQLTEALLEINVTSGILAAIEADRRQ